jgi:hypothetical protein
MPNDPCLAQFNVARALAPLDGPKLAGFRSQLATIHALADASPGFIWRLRDDMSDATSIRVDDDPRLLVNLSLWRTLDDLRTFTYRSDHARVMASRRDWFEKADAPYLVLWWTTDRDRVPLDEGFRRLELLQGDGPTVQAFTFQTPFDPTGRRITSQVRPNRSRA